MPVGTLPQRCPPTCDACQVTSGSGSLYHECPTCPTGTGTSLTTSGCCRCVPQYMYLEFLTDNEYTDPLLGYTNYFNNFAFGIGTWDSDNLWWSGELIRQTNNGGTDSYGSFYMYLEREGDQCYFVLRSDYLGYPEGSEQRYPITGDSDECRQLSITEEISGIVGTDTGTGIASGGVIRISGGQVLDYPIIAQCWPQCCIPYVCYQIVISGTIEVFNADTDENYGTVNFSGTVVLDQTELFTGGNDPLPDNGPPPLDDPLVGHYGPKHLCAIGGSDYLDTDDEVPCVTSTTVFGTPIMVGYARVRGNFVTVGAYATSSVPAPGHELLFQIDPPLTPGVACTERTLIEKRNLEPGTDFEFGDPVLGLCADGFEETQPVGAKVTITSVSNLTIHAGTGCENPDTVCFSRFSRCFLFRVRNTLTNGTCTDCDDYFGSFYNEMVIVYKVLNACTWLGTINTTNHCIAAAGGSYARWVLGYDEDTDMFTASYIVYNSSDEPLGVVVTYSTVLGTGTADTLIALAFVEASELCENWPSYIYLEVCNDLNRSWGACCVSAGYICDNMSEQECIQLGGTFLGEGTRCWLEGCLACDTNCDMLCARYEMAINISGAAFISCWGNAISILLSNNNNWFQRDPDIACRWYVALFTTDDGDWDFVMDVDTSVSPATVTLTGTLSGAKTASFTATGTGYCDGSGFIMSITSWSSTPNCDPFAGGGTPSIVISKFDGCPTFIP